MPPTSPCTSSRSATRVGSEQGRDDSASVLRVRRRPTRRSQETAAETAPAPVQAENSGWPRPPRAPGNPVEKTGARGPGPAAHKGGPRGE